MKGISITFYPHPQRIKDAKHQVFLRIIIDRKKAECATEFFVALKDWPSFQKKDETFDNEVSRIKSEIYRIKNRLLDDKKPVSAKIIKDILTQKQQVQVHLIDFFQAYINRIAALKKEYTKDNVQKYETTKNYLAAYLIKTKRTKDILITQVDFKMLSGFDDYLMTTFQPKLRRVLERNTVNQHHTRVRTILLRAIKEGHLTRSPYSDFKLVDEQKAPRYLTQEELQKLIDHPLANNNSLQRVRDIFLFSVYTGLRYSDALTVKARNVRADGNGDYYLYVEKQQKTNEPLIIPLLKPVVAIVKRYDNEERKITGLVLPKISNQKMNTYLKTIADLAGIDKKLTHHVARHTCATTILLNNGVSMEATGKWLGQKSLKSTQIYAKVTNQYLKKIAQSIEEKI